MNFCPNCGNPIQQSQQFCGNCGKSISTITSSNPIAPKVEPAINNRETPTLKAKKSFPSFGVFGILIVLFIVILIVSNNDDSEAIKEQEYQTQALVKIFLGTDFYNRLGLSKDELFELSGRPSEISEIEKNESSLRYINVVYNYTQVFHIKNGIVVDAFLMFNLSPQKVPSIINEVILQLKSKGYNEVDRNSKTKVLHGADSEISIYPPEPNENGTLLILIIASPFK